MIQQFGDSAKDAELLAQASIGDCFKKLDAKQVDYAVVPFENSTNGQVVFTYDLLRDWLMPTNNENPATFQVVAEQFVAIHHCLLSNAEDLSKVDKLYSHPQVWGQVTKFLGLDVLPGKYARVDTASTAKAAEMVKLDPSNTSACISSHMSAKLYDLPVKAPEIEDFKGNTTRFLVLGYNPIDTQIDSAVTLLMFVLDHDDPGALCLALGAFQKNNVSLSSISSRPSGRTRWQYVFYVEAAGSHHSAAMTASIESLRPHCTHLAIVGSFARSWRYGQEP